MATIIKEKALALAFPVLLTVLIGVGGYFTRDALARIAELDQRASDLEVWRASVNASRFTATDGKEVWKEIASIRETMAREQAPRWFVERVDRLESRLTDIEKQLRERKTP